MAEFVLEELVPSGRGEGAKFVWTAANRNIPVQPWSFGGEQRTARFDYPGTDVPTQHVLGPKYSDFSLSGSWNDKYNPLATPQFTGGIFADGTLQNQSDVRGYAKQTMRDFEAMCRRGNIVRISFQGIEIEGIITSWSFDYRREWDIGYTFTVSPNGRPGGDEITNSQKRKPVYDSLSALLDAQNAIDNFKNLSPNSAKTANGKSVRSIMAGSASDDIATSLDALSVSGDELSSVVTQRAQGKTLTAGQAIPSVPSVDTALDPRLALAKAVSVSTSIIGTAYNVVNVTGQFRHDTQTMINSAMDVLEFETWTRNLRSQARITIFQTGRTRRNYERQVDSDALAIYRPFEGESLYSISQRFYGTPHNWRLIMQRNNLETSILTAGQLLIIPRAVAK